MKLILGFCCFSILIAFYINNRSGWKNKNNMLLAVTIPEEEINNEEVKAIVNSYKKVNNIFFLIMAIAYIPILFIQAPSIQMLILFLGILILAVGGSRIVTIYSNKLMKLKKENKWVVYNCDTASSAIECDDYWNHGVYNNPGDKNLMVESRIGYGQIINLGHKRGKILNYGSYIFAIAVPVVVFIMIAAFDFKTFSIEITDNQVIIDAPFYGTTINMEDIEEVTLVKDIDITMRTNGTSTTRYGIGHFNVTSYGSSRIYAFWENDEYVALKVKEKYIFINNSSIDKTKEYYEAIKAHVK